MAIDILAAFESEPPELDFVFSGFLAGTVGALVAPGASGKSYWALQVAAAIASSDADILGLNPSKTGRVIYLAGEDPEIIIKRRLHSFASYLNPKSRQNVANNLLIEPLVGRRVVLAKRDDYRVGNDGITEAERNIRNIITGTSGARLLVLDTLTRFHELDENSNGDMAFLVSVLERIAAESGAAVLYLHHTSKGAVTGGTADTQQAARGASALIDNARWCGFVQKMTKEEAVKLGEKSYTGKAIGEVNRKQYVKFGVSKQNYAEIAADVWLKHGTGGILVPVDIVEAKKEDTNNTKKKVNHEQTAY
jgi:hypothetical protein